jgi:tRNA(fMet)-specific endonuclease VapC
LIRYLLDSNTISALAREGHDSAIASKVAQVGQDAVCTSIIVAAELRFGIEKSGSTRIARRVEAALSVITILPFESPADAAYGAIRWALERVGQPIGQRDLLIAAHAVALDLIVVTDNVGEFGRVPGLTVENWRRGS